MEPERSDEPKNDGGAADTAPAVVLPSPNLQGVSGSLQGFPSSISPVAPQPLLDSANGNTDGLATRVEDALAEDGRFTFLISSLGISVSDDIVRLSGTVPSEGQRQSLLSAVRAIPGIKDIEDDLQTP